MGIALVLVGAVLVLLSFATLDWYAAPPPGPDVVSGSTTFSALHHNADQLGGAGLASAYFSWLSWLLLIAVITVGAATLVVRKNVDAYRVGGLFLGLVGAATTYYALNQMAGASSGGGTFDHASIGVWLTLAGFLLAGAGAAIGPWPVVGQPVADPDPDPPETPRRPSPGLTRSDL